MKRSDHEIQKVRHIIHSLPVCTWLLVIQLCARHSAVEQLTSSRAECGKIGSHLDRQQLTKPISLYLSVTSVLHPSTVVKSLRVYYTDEQLSMDANPRHCAKPCFFRIRQLRRYRWLQHTVYMLILVLILPRLDYCNSLFVCSWHSTLHRLQRVQDAAARLLCGAPPRIHPPTLLKQFHCMLPVPSRIRFKLCTLMHPALHCSTVPRTTLRTLWWQSAVIQRTNQLCGHSREPGCTW